MHRCRGANTGGEFICGALRLVCAAALQGLGALRRQLRRRPNSCRPRIRCCRRCSPGLSTSCSKSSCNNAGPHDTPTCDASPRHTPSSNNGPRDTPSGNIGPRNTLSSNAGTCHNPSGNDSPRDTRSNDAGPHDTPSGNDSPRNTPSGNAGPYDTPSSNDSSRDTPSGNDGPRDTPSGNIGPRNTPSGNDGPCNTASNNVSPNDAPACDARTRYSPASHPVTHAACNIRSASRSTALDSRSTIYASPHSSWSCQKGKVCDTTYMHTSTHVSLRGLGLL